MRRSSLIPVLNSVALLFAHISGVRSWINQQCLGTFESHRIRHCVHRIPRYILLSKRPLLLFSHSDSREAKPASALEVPESKQAREPSHHDKDNDSAFDILAGNIALCLHASDMKRDDGFDGASTGWTSWVDDATAIRLQSCIDSLELSSDIRKPQSSSNVLDDKQKRDEAIRWIRWIKSCPAPVVFELSEELRSAVDATIPHPKFLREIDSTREEFLQRIGCRLMVLPSGETFQSNLRAPPGAMVYGKLLLGGVTRFRMIGSQTPKRRAGARTVISSSQVRRTPSWLQYGGPERNFEAIDAGPCAFLEILILPKGLELPLVTPIQQDGDNSTTILDEFIQDMTISQMKMNLHQMLEMVSAEEAERSEGAEDSKSDVSRPTDQMPSTSGQDYIDYLGSSFTVSVGGLQSQIDSIIRRVLDGRVIASVEGMDTADSAVSQAHTIQKQEMETLLDMGLQPVKGLLLYGPPGCGKTALAREISKVLRARPPKIVAAPELLDRWVGGSEKLVRELFQDAEDELRLCNGDATKSALHVVVIDEIDAVFRKRSVTSDFSSGEVTRASAVNQILAKLDGVKELGNVLVIGMTNRKELLDEALLRPGRLEVQIEISLPDREGRREIFQIHFDALRRRGLLSKTLCDAIDGTSSEKNSQQGIDFKGWRQRLQPNKSAGGISSSVRRKIHDLAADRWTGGFSGADIAGLVRAAGSLALARARKQDGGGIENLLITLEDVAQALKEVRQ